VTTELKEQKFRTWNKSRLHGEQKFSPRNKSWLEKLEQNIASSEQIATIELNQKKLTLKERTLPNNKEIVFRKT
jgi:hypothetical protein